jgi:hypothetical protein
MSEMRSNRATLALVLLLSPYPVHADSSLDELQPTVLKIEAMKRYIGDDCGFSCFRGATNRAVNQIVAAGETRARPLLLHLGHSKNPVARMAAATGVLELYHVKRGFAGAPTMPESIRILMDALADDGATAIVQSRSGVPKSRSGEYLAPVSDFAWWWKEARATAARR